MFTGNRVRPLTAGALLLSATLLHRDSHALECIDMRSNGLGTLVDQGVTKAEVATALAQAVQGASLPSLRHFLIGGNGLGVAAISHGPP